MNDEVTSCRKELESVPDPPSSQSDPVRTATHLCSTAEVLGTSARPPSVDEAGPPDLGYTTK